MRTTLAALFLLAAPRPATAEVTGTVVSGDLREASGLVASRRHPGILWTHNDSGDGPRLFAIREDGTLVATYTLTGALARDWEDIALGPGPKRGVDYLYVGDIGNNCECRTDLGVYRVPEPDLPPSPATGIPVTGYERISYTFPEKPANAEALLVDPRDGGLYLVDKVKTNTARLWRFPVPAVSGASVTLVEEARLTLPIPDPCEAAYLVTGGDVSADGSAIMLTTYTHVLRWYRGGKQGFASAMRGVPSVLHRHQAANIESLAIRPDGAAYRVLPEGDHPVLTLYSSSVTGAATAPAGRRGSIDDFEDGDLQNSLRASGRVCFSGQWFASATGAAGLPQPAIAVAPGRSLHVSLTRTAGGTGDAGLFVFTGLSSDWSPIDFSDAKGIRFRCRSNRTWTVRVRLEGVVNKVWFRSEAAFVKEVGVTNQWRTVDVRWKDFAQAPAACPGKMCVPAFAPTGIFMMAWEVPAAPGDPELNLDDIELLD